jgi:hypothetical protein
LAWISYARTTTPDIVVMTDEGDPARAADVYAILSVPKTRRHEHP